jgi:hypothetical protein
MENDWLVASLNNPNATPSEFVVAGVNKDNT